MRIYPKLYSVYLRGTVTMAFIISSASMTWHTLGPICACKRESHEKPEANEGMPNACNDVLRWVSIEVRIILKL